MSFALAAGVSGLQSQQKMLDIAGNNLANIETTAFKSSRITFSELFTETIKSAAGPSGGLGGTNPQQMGTGVGVAAITPNMAQGNIESTGNPLDLAINGEGYFALAKGSEIMYTRAGRFAVDSANTLVDKSTGYRVQRIGSVGEVEGFQQSGDNDIHIPYEAAMPAKASTTITFAGNLSADEKLPSARKQVMESNIIYSASGSAMTVNTQIDQLDQFSGGSGPGGQLGDGQTGEITISGFDHSGAALSGPLEFTVEPATTLADFFEFLNNDNGVPAVSEVQTLVPDAAATDGTFTITYDGQTTDPIAYDATLAEITAALELLTNVAAGDITVTGNTLDSGGNMIFTFKDTLGDVDLLNFDFSNITGTTNSGSTVSETTKGIAQRGALNGARAELVDGRIRITDGTAGYSQLDVKFDYSGSGTLQLPAYFTIPTVGGDAVKNASIEIYDAQGGQHTMSCAFVGTNTPNTWDLIVTEVTGDVASIEMSKRRIKGITFDSSNGAFLGTAQTPEVTVTYAHDISHPQTVLMNLGTVGELDGLTQFAGSSLAVAREQDGYKAGTLSTISVDNSGIVIGAFSNGIKRDLAAIQIGIFKNPAGLESVGNGFYIPSANSGEAISTFALAGGAGEIRGGALEKSNADVATEFVNMIQAQNGFQANARTIRVANDVLRELTSLIR